MRQNPNATYPLGYVLTVLYGLLLLACLAGCTCPTAPDTNTPHTCYTQPRAYTPAGTAINAISRVVYEVDTYTQVAPCPAVRIQ